jgi:hypothetical protein
MKENIEVSICLLSILLLSLALIDFGSADVRPTMKVEPTNYVVGVGDSFDVGVYIYDCDYYEGDDVYAWQVCLTWDPAVLAIGSAGTWGDFMDVPRVGPWGALLFNAPAGQDIVNVTDGSKFVEPSVWGGKVLIQDDSNSEINYVSEISGTMITLENNLAHTYTVAAGAGVYPWPTLTPSYDLGGTPYNRVIAGQTTNGAPPGVSGSGWLATFTFTKVDEGESALDIDNSFLGKFTYIQNTIGEYLGDDPSEAGDPGNWQSELYKESGYLILPWDEDFNADGAIDIFDLCSVAVHFGDTGSPGWIPADINDDGTIDILDLTLVSIKYGIYANA